MWPKARTNPQILLLRTNLKGGGTDDGLRRGKQTKVSDWLGIEARPKRGIMKKKSQRGKKHLVSEKEKNRLGEMFASYRQAKAKEGHEKG